jgi:hypothetical protein
MLDLLICVSAEYAWFPRLPPTFESPVPRRTARFEIRRSAEHEDDVATPRRR